MRTPFFRKTTLAESLRLEHAVGRGFTHMSPGGIFFDGVRRRNRFLANVRILTNAAAKTTTALRMGAGVFRRDIDELRQNVLSLRMTVIRFAVASLQFV